MKGRASNAPRRDARLAELLSEAVASRTDEERLASMARRLALERGFLGLFARSGPLSAVRLHLVGGLGSGELESRLAEEVAALEDQRGAPGLPRQLAFEAGTCGNEVALSVVFVWDLTDPGSRDPPSVLGGLVLEAGSALLEDPGLFPLLEVFQLELARQRASRLARDYRSGLELLDAVLSPGTRGESGYVARALAGFRRVLPFEIAAFALTTPGSPTEVRYLISPGCTPGLVQGARREMRSALAAGPGEQLVEIYHHEGPGPAAGPGRSVQSAMVLPVLGADGTDRGRLGFFSGSTGFFTTHHLGLLGLLAPALGVGLQSVRGMEGLRDRTLELEREATRVEAQLELARRIQAEILAPCPAPPPGLRIAHRFRMSSAVGGDFFAATQLGRHRYAVAIADVSGKGLPAGLLMAHTRGALLTAWDVNPDPGHVLTRLNRVVHESTDAYSFVTMLVLLVDTRSAEVSWASAGHEPILRLDPRGVLEELTGEDPPLGILERHEYREERLVLGPGENLVLLTDGFADALGSSGERFGRARIRETLEEAHGTPEDLAARLWERVTSWQGDREPADDLTAVVLGREPEDPGKAGDPG